MTYVFETTEFVDRKSSVGLSRVFLFSQRVLVRADAPGVNNNTVIGVVEKIVCAALPSIGFRCVVLESRFCTRSGLFFPATADIPGTGGWYVRLYAVDKPSITQVRFDVWYED